MVLDLSGLTFIDSAGPGMVATCSGTMDKTGGQFVVVGAPGKVHQMFKVTRLNQAVGVYQDLEAACKPLSAHPAAPEG